MSTRDVFFYQNQILGKANEIYDYYPSIDSTGDFKRLSGIDVLINSIRNLLLTPLGSYPFDPEYGSLLYQKVFEISDEISKTEIEYEVRQRIEIYDNRVKIKSVTITSFGGGKGVQVNAVIDRNGVEGKVSLIVSQKNTMLGIEDELSSDIL